MKKSTVMIALAVVLMCAGITAIVLGGCAKSGDAAGSAATDEVTVLEGTPIGGSETTVTDFPTAPDAEDKDDTTVPAGDDSKDTLAPQSGMKNNADVSGADVSGGDVSGGDVSGGDVSGGDVSGADVSGGDASGN